MPSPQIAPEIRQAWRALTNQQILDNLKMQGIEVELKNAKSRHFKLQGKVRPVELYASTGTVNAAPHQGKKSSTAKAMMPERALQRAVSLANIGH